MRHKASPPNSGPAQLSINSGRVTLVARTANQHAIALVAGASNRTYYPFKLILSPLGASVQSSNRSSCDDSVTVVRRDLEKRTLLNTPETDLRRVLCGTRLQDGENYSPRTLQYGGICPHTAFSTRLTLANRFQVLQGPPRPSVRRFLLHVYCWPQWLRQIELVCAPILLRQRVAG